jgi:sialate O-acetylesterase
MAVCYDIGSRNDVHPPNKKDVGALLARWVLKERYNKKIIPSGPLPLNATYNNGRVIISFSIYGKGLRNIRRKTDQGIFSRW